MDKIRTLNIAVFASHNGSDLQALIDGCKDESIKNSRVSVVISNNQDAYALIRAENEGIANYCLNAGLYPDDKELDRRTLEVLEEHEVDIIFLAGYLKKIGQSVLRRYENRIFNIHPALLPKYGGKGMYGMNVHRAVIAAGEKVSGVTVHRVNEEYDSGDIVSQAEVEVLSTDTPEDLAARVLKREHSFLVEVMAEIVKNIVR